MKIISIILVTLFILAYNVNLINVTETKIIDEVENIQPIKNNVKFAIKYSF